MRHLPDGHIFAIGGHDSSAVHRSGSRWFGGPAPASTTPKWTLLRISQPRGCRALQGKEPRPGGWLDRGPRPSWGLSSAVKRVTSGAGGGGFANLGKVSFCAPRRTPRSYPSRGDRMRAPTRQPRASERKIRAPARRMLWTGAPGVGDGLRAMCQTRRRSHGGMRPRC